MLAPHPSPDEGADERALAHVGRTHNKHVPPPPLPPDRCHRCRHPGAALCRHLRRSRRERDGLLCRACCADVEPTRHSPAHGHGPMHAPSQLLGNRAEAPRQARQHAAGPRSRKCDGRRIGTPAAGSTGRHWAAMRKAGHERPTRCTDTALMRLKAAAALSHSATSAGLIPGGSRSTFVPISMIGLLPAGGCVPGGRGEQSKPRQPQVQAAGWPHACLGARGSAQAR